MSKKIPYIFDCVMLSPLEPLVSTEPTNIGRLNVGVFTRYSNRNGSYITDEFAEKLIETATNCPVIGFFDKETGDWQGHVGPTLASAYGYVDYFVGWQTFEDTDGVGREYAVFSVVLFSDYFEEARNILGKSQSMEIFPDSIQGDWADFEGQEYFVYTTGKMAGLCILGDSKEPCFSASAFFEKEEGAQTQIEKFSSLLFELKAKVEEAKNFEEGGEQEMEIENILEPTVEEQVQEPDSFEEEPIVQEPETPAEDNSEFEALQNSFNELQENYNTLQASYEALQADYTTAQSRVEELESVQSEFENQINTLNEQLTEANEKLGTYESAAAAAEESRKIELIGSYENIISEEEIAPIREAAADFSYDELESKLAVTFSRKQLATESRKIPQPEPEDSAFAALMKKYKR